MPMTFTARNMGFADGVISRNLYSTPSQTNVTLYKAPVSMGGTAGNWTAVETYATVSPPPMTPTLTTTVVGVGNWWLYAKAADGETTAPIRVRVTAGTESVHYQCLLAVQSVLQALTFSGMNSENIEVVKVVDAKTLEKDGALANRFPGILLAPVGAETMLGGTNTRDDIGYPVGVFIMAKDDKDYFSNTNTYTLWREEAIKALRNQRLDDVPEVHLSRIEPAQIIHSGAFGRGLLISSFTVRYIARQSRGIQ